MYYSTEYGFSAYELADKRTGYTFIGLEYSGVLYTMSLVEVDYVNGITKLSNAIKMQQQKQLEVTAVWECEFTSYIFNFKAYCEYQREGTPVETRWGVYNNSSNKEENNLVEKMDVSVVFNDKEENYYYDLEDNIFNILFSDSEAKYYTKEGAEVEFNGDVLIIDVASNSEYTIHGIEDAYTFRNAMGTLKYKLGSLDNTNQVTIGFMFDIVA